MSDLSVQKITIIPHTLDALGYTMQMEEGNQCLMTQEKIENNYGNTERN